MVDTCPCGGVLHLDRRVHLTDGRAYDHVICVTCGTTQLRPVNGAPVGLDADVRRGYAR